MELQDKIGRQSFVNKICGLVDSLQKDQNFCLSINGAWGSGKSFVMQMIEEQLLQKPEYIIVKYDAWKNTFYSDPLIAVLYCILDTLENATSEDIMATIKSKRVKETAIEVAKSVGEAVIDSAAASNKVVGFIKIAIDKIKTVIKAYKETSLTNQEQAETYKSYSAFLGQTIKQLNEITTQEFYEDKQTKLIVLVDEIDRCLPDEQLKILERLHHLFDVKNCAVIVAMNQDCIAKTVQTIYGIDGYEYLRKFFDFTFKLEIYADIYFKHLLDELAEKLKKFNAPIYSQEVPLNIAYQCLLYGNKQVLNNVDNREISRYYNTLINICNEFGWTKLTQQYVFFVIIGLFIRKHISSSFLTKNEILENQDASKIKYGHPHYNPTFIEMPYFDYISYYLGVDRNNLPEEMIRAYSEYSRSIPQFSWDFNEMVYYSVSSRQYDYNEMRIMQGKHSIIVEELRELRRLIILYGGEQLNATNER